MMPPMKTANILKREVDFYPTLTSTPNPITVRKLLTMIRDGETQSLIESIRAGQGTKRMLPGATISVLGADQRAMRGPDVGGREHTGLVQVDIDKIDGSPVDALLELQDLPFILATFVSPSGTGAKAVAVTTVAESHSPDTHAAAFDQVCEEIESRTSLTPDRAIKAWNSLMFVPFDPDIWVAKEVQPLDIAVSRGAAAAPEGSISLQDVASWREAGEPVQPLPKEAWEALGRLAADAVPDQWEATPERGTRDQWVLWAFAVRNTLLGRPVLATSDPEYDERFQAAVDLCTAADPPWEGVSYARLFEQPNGPTRPTISLLESMAGRKLGDYPGGEVGKLKAARWQTVAELIDDETLTPPEIIVEDLIHARGVCLINAGSKVGKTWLSLALAMTIAGGGTWIGKRCVQGRTCFLNFELWPQDMRARLQALEKALVAAGCLTEEQVDLARRQMVVLNLRGHADDYVTLLPRITGLIRECEDEPFRLIVLDPLYRGLGDADENAAGDITRLYNALDRFVFAHNAALLITHHHPKGGGAQYGVVFERGAGSGVHMRAPDTICNLEEVSEASSAAGVPVYRFDCVQRSLPKPDSIALEWRFPLLLPLDPESDVAQTALDPANAAGRAGSAARRSQAEERRRERLVAFLGWLDERAVLEGPPNGPDSDRWLREGGWFEGESTTGSRNWVRGVVADGLVQTGEGRQWALTLTDAGRRFLAENASSD